MINTQCQVFTQIFTSMTLVSTGNISLSINPLQDAKKWSKLELGGAALPSCYTIVKSPDEKSVYFLSRLFQGYKLDAQNWRVIPLHTVGRPSSLSAGTAAAYTPDDRIVAVGGGWAEWATFVPVSFFQFVN